MTKYLRYAKICMIILQMKVTAMNIILLSGGSGKRLWPLSNDIRSKQFIHLFKTDDGYYQSMVQRVYNQIISVDGDANVTVATSKTQVSALRSHLGENVDICVEPCRRDTFPAILLATLYLGDIKGINEDDAVVVCPVDPYVETEYFDVLKQMYEHARAGISSLLLMGIKPTYPSEKYGYMLPCSDEAVSGVSEFKEKPSLDAAKRYIGQGALWNGGVFAFKLSYLIGKAKELLGRESLSYKEIYEGYAELEKISFDYAVVEKEVDIKAVRYSGEWKDIGTWNTLAEVMDDAAIGNALIGDECVNSNIINELDIPILAMGVKDMVIAASPEGILVSDKHQSSYIKPYVEKLSDRIMFAEKSWGSFRVMDVEDESLTLKVTLLPGHKMNYHSHKHRDEVWNIISGSGRVIVDGVESAVKPGDIVELPKGCKHTLIADTEIKVIEVQIGKDIDVNDKIKYDTIS